MSGQQLPQEKDGQSPSTLQGVICKESEDLWIKWANRHIHDGERNAYFIPTICENWTIETKGKAGKSTYPTLTPATTTKIQPTNRQEGDPVIQRVMFGLRQLSISEEFVALRQLMFGEYVGEPCYAAAAAHLPLPEDLRAPHNKNWKEGDFDILLIHRYYGLIFCEVKTSRDNVKDLNKSQQDVNDDIRRKLRQAVGQLDKAEVVLSHLVHDVAPGLRVCKVIALPNLTARQVQQAIQGDPYLTQDLCRCLEAADPADITGLCLCSDQLPDWIVNSIDTKLWQWWQKRVAVSGPDPQMTFDLYKRLVARLCGPAAEVTVSHVVTPHKISDQKDSIKKISFTRIALLPDEMILLNQGLPRVILSDQSRLLQLTATEWLRNENTVYVVSTSDDSHEACSMLYIELQRTARMQQGSGRGRKLHLLKYDFLKDNDVEKAVKYLSQAANNKPLHIIADAVEPYDWKFKTFCEMLLEQVPDLHLWAASLHFEDSPSGWKHQALESVYGYLKFSDTHSSFKFIGEDHSEKSPRDCETCGQEMGRLLRRYFDADSSGTMSTISPTPGSTATKPAVLLQEEDVVMEGSDSTSNHLGFVFGLRSEGVPVRVMKVKYSWWSEDRADIVFVTIPGIMSEKKKIIFIFDERFLGFLESGTSWLVTVTHSKSPEGCDQSPRKCNQPSGRWGQPVASCGQSTSSSQQAILCRPVEEFWINWVENAFPDLKRRAHFLPPVFMNRVPVTKDSAAGKEVLVHREAPGQAGPSIRPALSPSAITTSLQPTPVQDSDVRDDAAMQRVILCLQKLSETNKEVFVALSQLQFGQYLGEPCYAAAAAQLPSAKNLPAHHPSKYRDGDFDVLIIHQQFGLVICEVKSVGANVQALNMSQQDIEQHIRRKLGQAVGQLDKAEVVLSHLVHDVAPGLRVCKVIALPNLTARQVQRTVSGDFRLTQDLYRCLGAANPADVTGLCLCSDHLSDPRTPWDVNENVLRELQQWWQRWVAVSGPDPHMTSDLYTRLLARFCGPATTVTVSCVVAPRVCVKTLAQSVSLTGQCFAQITLFPEQVALLHKGLPRVFLHGPPGTGKTVVLQLKATEWLRNENPVYIVSTWEKSLAACSMLYHLLLQQVVDTHDSGSSCTVHFLKYDFSEEEGIQKAVNDLSQAAGEDSLYIISDEVAQTSGSESFETFCETLLERVPNLHLWAASCRHSLSSAAWKQEQLDRPLRSPPVVVREVAQAEEIRIKDVQPYRTIDIPSHTDGPTLKVIGQDHTGSCTRDCRKCGEELGRYLWSLMHPETATTTPLTSGTTPTSQPDRLQWRDVLVLWWGGAVNGSSFVSGLQSECVPVCLMGKSDIENVAMAASDVVWVADYDAVRGLERKVVVCLDISGLKETIVRLHAMSRCTSQLVVVTHMPSV